MRNVKTKKFIIHGIYPFNQFQLWRFRFSTTVIYKCKNGKIDGQGCTCTLNIGLLNKLLIYFLKKNENCKTILKWHNEQENNSDHTPLCCLAGVYRPAGGSCRPEVRFCETSDPGCSRTGTEGRSAWTSPCCRTGAGEWCSCRTYWVKILYLMLERRTSFTLKTCLVFKKIDAFIQESKNSNSNRL